MVKLLLDNRADYSLKSFSGRTPLHFVCAQANDTKSRAIIGLLKNAGVDLDEQDSNGITLMHIAFEKKRVELAHYLEREMGANPEILNKAHKTPFDMFTKAEGRSRILTMSSNTL
jgi:ankyrin repeat protein